MSESLIFQLLGWAATIGSLIGALRTRLTDLKENLKKLEKTVENQNEKLDKLKEVCDTCRARLLADDLLHPRHTHPAARSEGPGLGAGDDGKPAPFPRDSVG